MDDGNVLALAPRSPDDPVPLTFTQQWLWNSLEFSQRPGMRMVHAVVRFSGQLNVEVLRLSLVELTDRHESLRTRIVMADGHLMQHIDPRGRMELEVVDLTAMPTDQREGAAKRLVEDFIYQPTHVLTETLFVARLFKVDDCNHVLALAMDHLISDGTSRGIVLREIVAIYKAFARDLPYSVPITRVQFADFAVWQQKTRSAWGEQHDAYWNRHLAGARYLNPFSSRVTDDGATWGIRPVRLDVDLSSGLRALCIRERTHVSMAALTAYIALILRWSGESDCVVPFMTAGRPYSEIKTTVGFFSAPVFMRVELQKDDTLLDLLARISFEFRQVSEHYDCGKLVAQQPPLDFGGNPTFHWVSDDSDFQHEKPSGDAPESDSAVRVSPYDLTVIMRNGMTWKYGFVLRLREVGDMIAGVAVYRKDWVTEHTVERFERNLHLFAKALAFRSSERVTALECAP